MKPFDLEALKSGQEAITRDGRRAKFVGYCEDAKAFPLAVHIKGNSAIDTYAENGSYCSGGPCGADLVSMAPVKREAWVNIYCDGDKFSTKEQADRAADDDRIACIRIEWEE